MDECYFLASACNFPESNTSPWVFFMFLNCANGTKSCKVSHIMIKLLSLTGFICQKCVQSVSLHFILHQKN